MKFQDTRFWKNYSLYSKKVEQSSMRCSVDAILYWKLLTHFQFNQVLEIGVFEGLTTGLILESNLDCNILGVDTIDQHQLLYNIYPEAKDKFTFIKSLSQDVTLDNQEFDFIMIDGDHDYLPVKSDIENFLPRLKKSGVLAIDDYQWPGVASVIQELHHQKTGWVPFLRAEQTEFWHHQSCERGEFLDALLTDPISKFILIDNQVDEFGNTVCVAKTISMLTDYPEYFDLALKHYNI
jgi:predicted O-methyltransferase YrrM